MKALRPEDKALFRAARAAFDPDLDARKRMGTVLAAALGGEVVLGAGTMSGATVAGASATGGTATGASSVVAPGAGAPVTVVPATIVASGAKMTVAAAGLTKWLVLATLVVAGGGAGTLAVHGGAARRVPRSVVSSDAPAHPSARPTSSSLPVPVPPSPLMGVGPISRAEPPVSMQTPVRTAPTSAHALAADPGTSVVLEAQLLRDADGAILAADFARARELLESYERSYPRGVLREEDEAERVLLLCATGLTVDARNAAQRFLGAHPESTLSARVRSACR